MSSSKTSQSTSDTSNSPAVASSSSSSGANYLTEKQKQEQIAVQKRLQALKYLESQGQTVKTLTQLVTNRESGPKGDNTLELMRKQQQNKAGTATAVPTSSIPITTSREGNQSDSSKNKAEAGTNHVKAEAKEELPTGWQRILDAASNSHYYWNTATNETSWEKPVIATVVSKADLPKGWIEKIHASTKQVYYFHEPTKKISWTKPVPEAETSPSTSDNQPTKRQRM